MHVPGTAASRTAKSTYSPIAQKGGVQVKSAYREVHDEDLEERELLRHLVLTHPDTVLTCAKGTAPPRVAR